MYTPGHGKSHPFPHELDVQSYIRDATPPQDGESIIRIGILDNTIRAVACMCVARESDSLAVFGAGDQYFLVQALAVHIDDRGKGYGDQAVAQVIDEANRANDKYREALQGEYVPIVARIHENNVASQNLFQRHGFEYLAPYEDGLHKWVRDISPW